MSIKINYKNTKSKKNSSNLVLFADEKFSLKPLKKIISNSEFSYINDLLKTSDLNKKIFVFELNSKKKNNININKEEYSNLRYRKFRC